MPIYGLTDHTPALPVIGQLRKGEAKTQTNKPGRDLEYFRFTSEDETAVADFRDNYPAEPKQINVFLPAATTDENLDAWMEEWLAGGLVRRCDRKQIVLWRTDKGDYSTDQKVCQNGNCGCKQVGRLSVIIPELGRMAQVTALTQSIHDIINLTKQLRQYEALSGDLRGIPFVLTRRLNKISTPTPDGKRVRREKWLLSIESQPEWTKRKLAQLEQQALPDVPDLIEAPGYQVIDQLPAHISSPFEESESDPDEPHRKTLMPAELVNAMKAKVAKSTLKDPETGDALPVGMHPFGDAVVELIEVKLADALYFSAEDGVDIGDEISAVLTYLFGAATSDALTAPEADACLDWLLNSDKDKKHAAMVKPPAQHEARMLVKHRDGGANDEK